MLAWYGRRTRGKPTSFRCFPRVQPSRGATGYTATRFSWDFSKHQGRPSSPRRQEELRCLWCVLLQGQAPPLALLPHRHIWLTSLPLSRRDMATHRILLFVAFIMAFFFLFFFSTSQVTKVEATKCLRGILFSFWSFMQLSNYFLFSSFHHGSFKSHCYYHSGCLAVVTLFLLLYQHYRFCHQCKFLSNIISI